MFRYAFAGLCLFSFLNTLEAEQSISLPVTRDNSIVLVDGEWEVNAGQQKRLRIKGNQHIVAMSFDTSAIRGKRVLKATLVCAKGEHTLSAVSLSTIAADWDENASSGLTAGIPGIEGWGVRGLRFPAVCGGNSWTLVAQSNSLVKDGRYHWDVPPDMISAIAAGAAFGLAIHEHDADYSRNPTICSREESGRAPVLVVEVDDYQDPVPEPAIVHLSARHGTSAATLDVQSPFGGFVYEVSADGHSPGRHNLPLVSANTQQISLRDLPASIPPDTVSEITVTILNRTGQRSAPAVIRGTVRSTVALPGVAKQVSERALTIREPVRGLSVIPVVDKYDLSGKAVGDLPVNYRSENSIFDGGGIRLQGAAGEVMAFQMLLKGQGRVSIRAKMSPPEFRVDLFQAVYVSARGRMIPDPLLPLPELLELNSETDQVIVADLYIPFDARPGVRHGEIRISDGRSVPLEVTVSPFAIPRKATFACEMNGYGMPDHVNEYYSLQTIACDHRVHANILHYSHNTAAPGSRKSQLDMRLKSGRRMNNARYDDIAPDAKTAWWDDFAEAFGPVLDGSLFQHGHRGSIPVPGFYLTFHESWPLNCRAWFNGNQDAYQAFADTPEYSRTFVNILRDFSRMAEARGWKETGFQVYLNNKGSLNEQQKAPWILDEPTAFWDYRALRYYGELTDQGRSEPTGVHIDYRIDISRPEFTRGQLDRRSDLWVVSTSAFRDYRRLVTDRIQQDRLKVWIYGTTNPVEESNRGVQAWALDGWQFGATGVVPWQTINKSGSAMKEADQLGLFIFDTDQNGTPVVRHSLRLKAYREVQQLIEYLNLAEKNSGWSREQMRSLVSEYIDFTSTVQKTDEADAGTSEYPRITAAGLESLRRVLAASLSEPQANR